MTKHFGIHLILVFCFYEVMITPLFVSFQTWCCSICWNSN